MVTDRLRHSGIFKGDGYIVDGNDLGGVYVSVNDMVLYVAKFSDTGCLIIYFSVNNMAWGNITRESMIHNLYVQNGLQSSTSRSNDSVRHSVTHFTGEQRRTVNKTLSQT